MLMPMGLTNMHQLLVRDSIHALTRQQVSSGFSLPSCPYIVIGASLLRPPTSPDCQDALSMDLQIIENCLCSLSISSPPFFCEFIVIWSIEEWHGLKTVKNYSRFSSYARCVRMHYACSHIHTRQFGFFRLIRPGRHITRVHRLETIQAV